VNGTLNLLVGLAMGLNLIALASTRLPSIIRAAALQGMVLGLLPLLLKHESSWLVGVVAVLTVTIKGLVIPGMLRHALRAAQIDREVEPLIEAIARSTTSTPASCARSTDPPLIPLVSCV